MAQHTNSTDPPGLAQVLDDIAWFRAVIREAGREGRDAVREARAAYAPFLLRRLKLLSALRDGAAGAWREYRPARGLVARPRDGAGPGRRGVARGARDPRSRSPS